MASTDALLAARLAIEPIDAGESEAVWPLSIEAGWNQNLADWRFMLRAGRGYGVRDAAGKWQASALFLPLGPNLVWISMVLVTRARRRSGLGTCLLERCIDEARKSGAVAGLDATELGRPIYLPLGFHDLYRIGRWHLDHGEAPPAPVPRGVSLRAVSPADLAKLAAYDRPRSGMERPAMLAHLAARQPGLAWLADTADGRIAGFALGREGRTATSIGPVVADSEQIALALIAKAIAAGPSPLIIDAPETHQALRGWLERHGAVSPRAYTRMTLGTANGLDDPRHLFALAGPELG